MIGQRGNLEMIDKWVADGCPQFFCIVGSRGSGKRMLAKYIAEKLKTNYSEVGIKVEDVRDVIDSATRYGGFYVFADADTMSVNAKNALLKITEEPPKDAYFVVTIQDESSLLDTIKSRAQLIRIEPYSEDELRSYFFQVVDEGDYPEATIITSIASTPYDVDLLIQYGCGFIDYVNLVVDNIREVEPANAFKSVNRLALKNEEDKYDLTLFFRTVITVCRLKLVTSLDTEYAKMILATSHHLSKLDKVGVNKQQLYDSWVFEVRSI